MSTENMVYQTSVLVIGYQSGSGTNAGLSMFLMCQYRGKMFKVPCETDLDRRSPPKIGARVRVAYTEVAGGVPSNPTLHVDAN